MAEEEMRRTDGLPEEEFSKLLQSVSTMAPLIKGLLPQGPPVDKPPSADTAREGKSHGHCAKREALLLALKPYLSPARCEAVDYFIRLARVGDAIRSLQ